MSRKRTLPGVDEKALASLAHMFPATSGEGAPKDAPPHKASPSPESKAGPVAPSRVANGAAPPVRAEAAPADPRPIAVPVAVAVDSSRTARVALAMALVALVIAGFSAAPPAALQRLTNTFGENFALDFLTGRRSAIDAQLTADGAAIREIEFRLANLNTQDEAIRAAASRLNAVQQNQAAVDNILKGVVDRIEAAESAAKDAAAKLTSLAGTVEALGDLATRGEATAGDSGRGPERHYLAAIQLRSAVQGSGPYTRELEAVSRSADGNAELQAAIGVLAAHAQTGVPSVGDLRVSFAKSVSGRIPPTHPTQPSMTSRGVSWVRSIIPGGQAPRADSTETRNGTAVAMAERSLADGQLAAAVDQLLLLEDRAPLLAAEWLREASARLANDKAAATVVSKAFDRLNASP
jgi:hypothetical protein